VRQRLEQHRANPSCAACHAVMDPIGFSLEPFDLIGKLRETDEGVPVNAAGKLSTADNPYEAEPYQNGTPTGDAQRAWRHRCCGFQHPHGQIGNEGPKQALDHQDKTETDDEIVHCRGGCAGGALPCGSEKYLKKSESGEMSNRVSPDLSPFSYACIER